MTLRQKFKWWLYWRLFGRREGKASLGEAMSIIARCNTRDDDRVGFVVYSGCFDEIVCSNGEYIEAWKTIRAALNMPTEPEHY